MPETVQWTGVNSGDLTDAANWNPARVPGSDPTNHPQDVATFNGGSVANEAADQGGTISPWGVLVGTVNELVSGTINVGAGGFTISAGTALAGISTSSGMSMVINGTVTITVSGSGGAVVLAGGPSNSLTINGNVNCNNAIGSVAIGGKVNINGTLYRNTSTSTVYFYDPTGTGVGPNIKQFVTGPSNQYPIQGSGGGVPMSRVKLGM
jgi:hypothetical protein